MCPESATLQWLFGPNVWSYQSLPELSPSSVLKALHFSGCVDQMFGHISHYRNSIKCTYSTALQWQFGLQV
ncbi:hypothetical protein TNCT_675061 [Trichonephila clavata]|uniref:Uncharacterized protein n=1 Tax=Trichonephila clavata TaxID=2740835 RepID=A0A8X6LMV0_TRICU|nr:hypothetical protein TNCT_675061 [Trichonephila clavata]